MERAAFSPGMKAHRFLLGAAVLPLALLNGCSTMNNTDKGALIGGTAGAVGGGIIGHACKNTAAGAVIGGVVGAVTGAVIGDHKDQKEVAQARQMTIDDVVRMTQDHISDTIIVGRIRDSGMVFHLTAAEIETLKANGVSDQVVMEMQATGRRPQRVYVAEPAVQPVYVIEQPPPPPSVGIGVTYSRGR